MINSAPDLRQLFRSFPKQWGVKQTGFAPIPPRSERDRR